MLDIIKLLFPPDTPAIARWRIMMFAFAVMVIVHIMWACGMFKEWGVIGFARADETDKKLSPVVAEVRALKGEVRALKEDQLETSLYEALRLRCQAQSLGKQEMIQFYSKQVRGIHQNYFVVTNGVSIIVPTCAEVGYAVE